MNLQTVPFHPEEFRALKTTISSYLNYLEQMVPPSTERNHLITMLQPVYVRLQQLLMLGQKIEGQRLWLTEAEVAAIDIALVTFSRLVHLVIRSAEQREDMLLELDKMRWRVRSLLFPPVH